MTRREAIDAHLALYADGRPDGEICGPGMCVVPTRYQGCYEGGRFAAIPVSALDSAAFGQDCAAADWWHENRDLVGVGSTPDEAVADYCAKRVRVVPA